MNRILLAFCCIFLALTVSAQTVVNIADGGTVTILCGETYTFVDSGGNGDYSNNESYQITLCPEAGAESSIAVVILTELGAVWDVAEGDFLSVYDGNSTVAPLIGTYSSANALLGFNFTATSNNASGCLTFVFLSNISETAQGWSGTISCGTAWQPYTIEMSSDPADGENLPGYVDICPNEEVTFTVEGTYPFANTSPNAYAQSDDIVTFKWSMGDGTIYEGVGLTTVTHTYDGQFGYNVTVRSTDEFSQFRTDTLKVRVSTTPDYTSAVPEENPMCLGESTVITGGYIDEENFAGFEPVPGEFFVGGLSAGQVFLPDATFGNPGLYTDTLFIAGMVLGATITDASDLINVCLNIEHSFIGDLDIWITCPNGTVLPLLNGYNPGPLPGGCPLIGGTHLGEAFDPLGGSDLPGIGYDYCFTMDAVWGSICEEFTAGNTVQVDTFEAENGFAANAMPAGEYQPEEPFDLAIGCPVEGPWVVHVQDNLASDNGYIFEWSIQVSQDFFPEPETYVPVITDASWAPDPTIIASEDLSIEVQPSAPGTYSYQFAVSDNFGCTYDTTVSVTVVAFPEVEAGDNLFLACSTPQLNGLIDGASQPQCANDGGDYEHCYGNSANDVFTYCPDNPGDGITFLTLQIISGSIENFWDALTVFDGPTTASPILAQGLAGNLAGQSFTATNDGCITFQITSDGIVSCQSGGMQPLVYTISCTAGPQFGFSWEPANLLDNPNVLNPNVEPLTQDQVFTLTAFPLANPNCVASDQVEVLLGPAPSPGEDAEITFCFNGAEETLINYLGGDPADGGVWIAPDGTEMDGILDPSEDTPGIYTYSIPACNVQAELTVDILLYEIEVAEPDTTICQNGTATLAVDNVDPSVVYTWSTGATGPEISVSPSADALYTVSGAYGPGCTTEEVLLEVEVLGGLSVTLSEGANVCPGDSLEVSVSSASGGLEPYTFVWTSDYGDGFIGNSGFVIPEEDANWCAVMTDACESTPIEACVFVGLAPSIDPTFTPDTLGGCVPVGIRYFGNADNPEIIASASWDFGNGDGSSNPQIGITTYNSQGLYSVTYTAVTVDGCVFSHTENDLVTIYNAPFASFNIDPQVVVLPSTQADFTNYSLGSDTFVWVVHGMDTLEVEDLEYDFPPVLGEYEVTLFASNAWGCIDSLTRLVSVVDEFTMFIPNSFTPDNDGLNDVWRFQGIDVDEDHFQLLIFNRWGEVVHRTTDFNAGWNGNVNNGDYYVPDGVYTYRIETRSKTTQDNKVITGQITIIR